MLGFQVQRWAIGLNHSVEILFEVSEYPAGSDRRLKTTIIDYNMDQKEARMIPELTGFIDPGDGIFFNLVETISTELVEKF